MTQKKIQASDVIGNSYYIYTLTSTNNTPSLNGTINITCNVTNVYGQAVSGKSITLYQNSTSKGAKTTDSSGNASWNSISMSSAGLQVFRVENSKIEVFVDNKSDVGHTHSGYVSATKVTSWQSTPSDSNVPSEKLVKDSLDGKANSTHNHTVSNITDFPTSMTPSSHTHGNLQNNGQVGSTAQTNKNVVTDSSGKITTEDKPTIPSPSSSAPLGLNPTNSGVVGTSTNYARADHKHSHTSFTADGTSGQTGYVKVFQMKVTSTYQDRPIHFHVLQRGAKTIANVTIKFKNVNGNDPDIDSIMHSGYDNEYYVYKESTSTWSFIALKTEAYDNIAILDLKTSNGAISFTSLNTHITTVPSEAIQSTHIVGDIPFGTDEGTVAEGNHTHTKSQITDFPTIPSKTSDLTNDSGFLTSHQSLSGYLQTSDVKDNLTSTDTNKPLSAKQGKELKTLVDGKQATLVSGTSIKTVNNESLLGSGNISISGGNNVDIVTAWESELSDNKVASEKLVKDSLDGKANSTHTHTSLQKTTITSGNLNDYTDTGWYSYSTTDSSSITNTPENVGSVMEVLDDYGNGQYIVQKVYPIKSDKYPRIYIRIKYASNGWGKWERIRNVGIIDGGVNLLTPNRPTPSGTGGVSMTEEGTLYGEPVYLFDLSSVSDTTKYNDFYFVVTPDKFAKGDIFTLSFWAKGNSGNTLKTYFAGTSGYVNVKRLHSNSTFTGNAVEGSFGDGSTTYNLTTGWQHYYVTYQLNTTGDDTLNKSIHLRVHGGNKIYVSRIQLERGEVATDYSSKYNQTTKVPSGANLNDYIRGGFYYNDLNTESANISNLAETGKAFFLLVEDWGTSANHYTKQTITHYGTNKTYTRIRNGSTWGSWSQLALKSEVPVVSTNLPKIDHYYTGTVGTSTKYSREDHAHPKTFVRAYGGVATATYVNVLRIQATNSWQDKPIQFSIQARARQRPTYVSVRLSNTNISSGNYSVSSFVSWGDKDQTLYLRQSDTNTFDLIIYKRKDDDYQVFDLFSGNPSVTITATNTNYGTTAPSSTTANPVKIATYIGVPDTDLTWTGVATNNSVSPLTMAMDSEFGANRLAYFPSSRIKVEYSTDGGSTWTELTTGNYSEANKTKLVTTTSPYMYLGNNITTDYSKNRLRITIDVGDMNADSLLYMVTRKIALYTATANATGFTCQLQTQTYAQYNSNSGTFSNYGSAFSLGGWSGWNTYPINFTLGGYSASNQTNSSSTRIKALRLYFSQTGGTGNGFITRIRLYGETAYSTTSQYANNNHIYTIDENQNATFPSKIIKEGGTSSQFLMANGDVSDDEDILNMIDTALGHMITNWEDYE